MKVCKECNIEKPKSEFWTMKANRDGLYTRCKECLQKIRRGYGHKKPYTRVCVKCGDVKQVSYKTTGKEKCSECVKEEYRQNAYKQSQKNRKPKKERKKYLYFCPACPAVNESRNRHKTAFCFQCSRKYSKKKKAKIEFSFVTMQMMRIEELNIKREKKKKVKAKKKKVYTQIGTDGAKENKVTVRFDKEKPSKAKRESEEEMIQKFLQKNKVTVCASYTANNYDTGCKMGIGGY